MTAPVKCCACGKPATHQLGMMDAERPYCDECGKEYVKKVSSPEFLIEFFKGRREEKE